MEESGFQIAQEWVRQWGYLGIVALMVCESAPVVGLMLPGIFIAIALGILTASNTLPLMETWLFASLGAMLGDSLGYWLGRLGSKKLHHHLRKLDSSYQRLKASAYLDRYGAVGVAIGRFIWFVHPMVPSLAGIAAIPPQRFYFYDLPACLLWVGLYLSMGHWFAGIWL